MPGQEYLLKESYSAQDAMLRSDARVIPNPAFPYDLTLHHQKSISQLPELQEERFDPNIPSIAVIHEHQVSPWTTASGSSHSIDFAWMVDG